MSINKTDIIINQLSSDLLTTLQSNGIDLVYYNKLLTHNIPRYVRIVHNDNNKNVDSYLQLLQQQYSSYNVQPTIIPYVYQIQHQDNDNDNNINNNTIQHTIRISQAELYNNNTIHGIDLSSILACIALQNINNNKHQHILDICCAPGNKLLVLNDLFEHSYITGIDCVLHRLYTTRALCRKYINNNNNTNQIRLCLADGTFFDRLSYISKTSNYNYILDCRAQNDCCSLNAEQNKRLHKEQKAYNKHLHNTTYKSQHDVQQDQQHQYITRTESTGQLYDSILIDAQCTHDGSISHMLKHINNTDLTTDYITQQRIVDVCKLQYNLLCNAFKLLKVNGHIVYSTCSLMKSQNEDVISAFMSAYSDQCKIVDDVWSSSMPHSESAHSVTDIDTDTSIHDKHIYRLYSSSTQPKTSDQLLCSSLPVVQYERTSIIDTTSKQLYGYGIRFDPLISNTSALFICKLQKIA